MQGIGEILKRTREAQGITLEEVAEATKIRRKYLEALEKEEFDVLPGEVYAKGFATAYLKYLGIKDDPAVVEVMKPKPKAPEEPAHVEEEQVKERRSRAARQTKPAPRRKKSPAASFEEKPLSKNASLIVILSVAAIILLLALQWVYTRSQQDQIPPENVQQQEDINGGQQDGEGDPENAAEPDVPPEPAAPVYHGLEMHLEILDVNANATDQCWMQITVDGKKTELTLSEGQTQDVQANESIQLSLGNAGVVKITLNGQDLGVMGSQGQVVKKEFKLEDYTAAAQ